MKNSITQTYRQALSRYWRVWLILATNALQEAFINRATNVLFLVGKTLRFGMSLLLLFLFRQQISDFAGYTPDQVVVFFLTYQFIDLVVQVFYRGVYVFGNIIRTGEFDFDLSKPINPLFRALAGKPDIDDAFFLIPTTIFSLYILSTLDLNITLTSALLYIFLLINSFLIATSLHILVLCLGLVATEIESAIWLYRDISRLGQFPTTIYMELLRVVLFFLVPVGFMITIPAEVLLNLEPTYSIPLAILVGVGFFWGSLKMWHYSLKLYTSASS
jgi:ABC-2 type transport system permease protein